MIDLKATLDKVGMSVYRFAKEIGRHSQQLYGYTNGKNMSPLMEEKIRAYFEDNAIEIVEN